MEELHPVGRDHGSVGYVVPREWASLTDGRRGMQSMAGFKRGSVAGFKRGSVDGLLAG